MNNEMECVREYYAAMCERAGSWSHVQAWERARYYDCHICRRVVCCNIRQSSMLGSCPICYEVISHMWMNHATHEWVMSQIWRSHDATWEGRVTYIKDSFLCAIWLITYEWVMSHIWMSHVTHMNESCHTYEWVTSHMWMSHIAHMNESCDTHEKVMSHIWMSDFTHRVANVQGRVHLSMSQENRLDFLFFSLTN